MLKLSDYVDDRTKRGRISKK